MLAVKSQVRLPLEGKPVQKISSLCSEIFAEAADEVE
jgi:hypothetical protein